MKKQIIYPKLIPRLFSTTIDLVLISFLSPIIMSVIARVVYVIAFKDYLAEHNISWMSFDVAYLTTQEFLDYTKTQHKTLKYMGCIILLATTNFTLMGSYFVIFWNFKGATPGKMLMGMKIVDADTLAAPTRFQLIRRFLGYVTAAIGIWSIIFTAKHQAMHDKISNTVVIKS
jgi:uncharacterized RDD family membrane protein YckC